MFDRPFLTNAKSVWEKEQVLRLTVGGFYLVNSEPTTKDIKFQNRVNGSIAGHAPYPMSRIMQSSSRLIPSIPEK